jgi:hypothetical protein
MKIAISELEHLREEVKNCHKIIKNLQKKREFVGLTDEEAVELMKQIPHLTIGGLLAVEDKLKEKNT